MNGVCWPVVGFSTEISAAASLIVNRGFLAGRTLVERGAGAAAGRMWPRRGDRSQAPCWPPRVPGHTLSRALRRAHDARRGRRSPAARRHFTRRRPHLRTYTEHQTAALAQPDTTPLTRLHSLQSQPLTLSTNLFCSIKFTGVQFPNRLINSSQAPVKNNYLIYLIDYLISK